jgi:hypothetical protein
MPDRATRRVGMSRNGWRVMLALALLGRSGVAQRRPPDLLPISGAGGPGLLVPAVPSDRGGLQGPAPWPAADGAPPTPPGRRPPSWWAPVASLLVPGSGQGLLRQSRAVGFVAAEAFLLVRWLDARQDGTTQRSAYRRIAREVARARFGGPLAEGPWSYYESMERFLESGQYDRGGSAGFLPESDEATFNGAQWRLARETYWRDPDAPPSPSSAEYQRALAFYQARAVQPAFRWSWANAQLQQDEYRQRIRRSNASYREAATLGGLVLANHLLSLVDSYVSVRLGRLGPDGTPAPPGGGRGPGGRRGVAAGPLELRIRVPMP